MEDCWPSTEVQTPQNQNTPGGGRALPQPSCPHTPVLQTVTKPNLASSCLMWALTNPFDKKWGLDQLHLCPGWNAGIGFSPEYFTLCCTVWSHWAGETHSAEKTLVTNISPVPRSHQDPSLVISHVSSSDRGSKLKSRLGCVFVGLPWPWSRWAHVDPALHSWSTLPCFWSFFKTDFPTVILE